MASNNRQEYKITNDKIKPDWKGELGGVKIETRKNGDRIVRMSPVQAKWFIENNEITRVGVAPPVSDEGSEPKRSKA